MHSSEINIFFVVTFYINLQQLQVTTEKKTQWIDKLSNIPDLKKSKGESITIITASA